MRLIDADALMDKLGHIWKIPKDWDGDIDETCETAFDVIENAPTVEAVPLSDVYRLIAGHSDYHGDNILSALTCVAEGKEVKPIKPVEAKPVVHGSWETEFTALLVVYRCSECNCATALGQTNFCPECGADMRGENDGRT